MSLLTDTSVEPVLELRQALQRRLRLNRNYGTVVVICLGCVTLTAAEDWPHWRGSRGRGLLQEASGWNGSRWIDSKPTWEANVGEGASSPLLAGEQVFTLGHRDGQNIVSCLDATTGKATWTTSYKTPRYAPQRDWGRRVVFGTVLDAGV